MASTKPSEKTSFNMQVQDAMMSVYDDCAFVFWSTRQYISCDAAKFESSYHFPSLNLLLQTKLKTQLPANHKSERYSPACRNQDPTLAETSSTWRRMELPSLKIRQSQGSSRPSHDQTRSLLQPILTISEAPTMPRQPRTRVIFLELVILRGRAVYTDSH
jgi:hypothetical protein